MSEPVNTAPHTLALEVKYKDKKTQQEKTRRTNYVRFYPGRTEQTRPDGSTSNQLLFGSARYARVGSEAGPLIGAATEHANGVIQLRSGAGIIGGDPHKKDGELERNWTRKFRPRGGKILKSFIDLLELQQTPSGLTAVPYEGGNFVTWEIGTGDLGESEEAYMAALKNKWHHGSVEYIGDTSIHIDASMKPLANVGSRKGRKRGTTTFADQSVGVAQTFAQLNSEDGLMVNGVYVWLTRTWTTQYTEKESEIVFVRQGNHFYRCLVHNKRAWAIPYTKPDAENRYNQALALTAALPETQLIAPTTGVIEPEVAPEGTPEEESAAA